jgi:hypothetical protein
MIEFYVLPRHACQALDINPGELDLPRCGYGVSGDALWQDPRFIEIRRERAAIAEKMAAHRNEIHIHINIDRRAAAAIQDHLDRAHRERRAEIERQDTAKAEERRIHRLYMRQRRKDRAAARASVV